MKGIILAGGSGTRLYPTTKVISKQLLPVYDKPMIYYPLSVLMLAEIRDILLISTPEAIDDYRELLNDGSQLGINISYAVQDSPRGLADAFIVGEDFIGDNRVALILGDNLFYGHGLTGMLKDVVERKEGATIFGYYVNNPEQFGVVEFDEDNNVISIEEKPEDPKSNFAVPGLYFYDNKVVEIAKQIETSDRGELEITSVHNKYLKRDELKVELMGRGMAWLDTGTPSGLMKAANFIEAVQSRQGLYIACIEEIAYNKGYIDAMQVKKLAEPLLNTDYGRYLMKLVKENNDGKF